MARHSSGRARTATFGASRTRSWRRPSRLPRDVCRRWASGPATASGSCCRCSSRRSSRSWHSAGCGPIYTPIFSGYGAPAIATRLADCEASVLITADGFLRRGAWVPLKAVADAAVADAPSVRRVLVVRRAGAALATPWDDERDAWWDDARARRGGRRRRRRRRSRDAVPAHLHLGHDRPPEGRRPRARWLPDQGRAGPGAPVRPRPGRHAVLVHRPRLDDGSVGDLRVADARRAARPLRRRARLPGSGPAVGAGRTPSDHAPRPVADRHPRPDGPWRGAGPLARPFVAARPGFDRRALEPRSLVVVLPRGRRGALPDRQLLRRHGGLGRDRQWQRRRADQARVVLRSVHRDRGRRRQTLEVRSVAAKSGSSSSVRRCRA